MKSNHLSNYYISFNKLQKALNEKTNFRLKYDYCNQYTLQKMKKLSNVNIPSAFKKKEIITNVSCIDAISKVLDEMDEDKIIDFFETSLYYARFIEKDIDVEESKSRVLLDNSKLLFEVIVPNTDHNSDLLNASIIHELAHFSLIYCKDNVDYLEYSETLPIFFEYMSYCALDKENGYDCFINNRLGMLKANIEDLKQDIMYALNPSYLNIAQENYVYSIASNITYLESIEFVLQLIEARKNEKTSIDKLIGRALVGEETLKGMEEKIGLKVSNHQKIYELCR